MAFSTELLPNLPVIVTTYEGHIAADELLASQQKIMELMQAHGLQRVYAIQDIQRATSSFVDIVNNIKAFKTVRQEAETARRTETVLLFVGKSAFLTLIAGLFGNKQYGGYRVVSFRQMDDALQFIDLEMTHHVTSVLDHRSGLG